MKKKIFCVIRKEVSSQYCYIEATSKEEAELIAENVDSEAWRENQDYNSEITKVSIVKDESELRGRIINTGNYETDYRFEHKIV